MKTVVALILAMLVSILSFLAYKTYVRATIINASPDPLYAACAFDADGKALPPSCMALLTQRSETPK